VFGEAVEVTPKLPNRPVVFTTLHQQRTIVLGQPPAHIIEGYDDAPPDLILVDANLPDGWQLIGRRG